MASETVGLIAALREIGDESCRYVLSLSEPHPFVSRFLASIGWGTSELQNFMTGLVERSLHLAQAPEKYARSLDNSEIPKITHKIWLTSSAEPSFPPDEYLDRYFSMCAEHPAEWTHFFWTNSTRVAEHIATLAKGRGAKLLVTNTDGLECGAVGQTIHSLTADRKFVLAADVLKFVLLNRFGGIYSDLGLSYDQVIRQVAERSDYTFMVAYNLFFQTSFLSAPRESMLTTMFLALLAVPEAFHRQYALDESQTVYAGSEVHSFSGLGYTVSALLFLPRNANAFIFAQGTAHITWRAQQSWYGDEPKHGNALIHKTDPTTIRKERYDLLEAFHQQHLIGVNADGRLREMLSVSLKLFEYFQSNPPALCEKFRLQHADRASGWHNYAYIEWVLITVFATRDCALLEIGDSPNLWGRAGGAERSGSIAVWRKYVSKFAMAAEIDRDSKSAPLDAMALINQRQRESLRDVLARKFDVVIDNGFHDSDASENLLRVSLGQMGKDAVHLIEAVPLDDRARWTVNLDPIGRPAFILNLPSEFNQSDNCLVAVLGSNAAKNEPQDGGFTLSFPEAARRVDEMFSVPQRHVDFDAQTYSGRNVFAERFGGNTDAEWRSIWLETEKDTLVNGVEFPALPSRKLQLQIHGSATWAKTIEESFDFYEFVKRSGLLDGRHGGRFLDFGSGWGRMTRPFMREFALDRMFGFDPNGLVTLIARSLNPYITFLSGGFEPDGTLPESSYDLLVGWSVFSHLSDAALRLWLAEIARVLVPGGVAVLTCWGLRFLERLQRESIELSQGKEIHWYSKLCIETAGNLEACVEKYKNGQFVWFTNTDSTVYGEAFLPRAYLEQVIRDDKLPVSIKIFDTSALYQDAFVLERQ